MSWQLGILVLVALVLVAGGLWFERSRPSARILAAVAALAALGVAGRVALAPVPNVVATTDIALLAGYTLGGPPGFAVGALSALISNFWLGQGPWTPWQMAGWGMVGIGGAALAAASGRRLGRWGLAAAAAMAGLLYGALLDLSVMVNFGGEQSLDRYLALSARAIPFNIAHALGNAALMVAAGPALVRMLSRYRERFEVRWSPSGALGPGAAALLVAIAIVTSPLLAPRPAAAGAESAAAAGATGWLAKAQNGDGGWGTAPGASSNVGMTSWAMLGLEAAGRNPRDVRSGGRDAVGYLRRNAGVLRSTGDLERTILALEAAGVDSRRFAGRDFVAELRKRRSAEGSWEGQVNLTAFALLALESAGEDGPGSAVSWLRKAQNRDGGWGSTRGARSEPDSTGAVLQALAAAGGGGSEGGVRWLEGSQRRDGGWSLTPGASSNAQSTAWAVQGLIAAGANPGRIENRGQSGLDFLAARRAGDGHYSYSRTSDQTPVWVTSQAMTAVAGKPYPLAAVPRSSGGGNSGGGGTGGGSGGTESSGGVAAGAGGGQASGGKKAGGRGKKSGRKRKSGGSAASAEAGADPEPLIAAAGAGVEPPEADGGGPAAALLLGGGVALAALLGGAGYLLRRRFG